jgi:hypothetical protein
MNLNLSVLNIEREKYDIQEINKGLTLALNADASKQIKAKYPLV